MGLVHHFENLIKELVPVPLIKQLNLEKHDHAPPNHESSLECLGGSALVLPFEEINKALKALLEILKTTLPIYPDESFNKTINLSEIDCKRKKVCHFL